PLPPRRTLSPYTTLFRSKGEDDRDICIIPASAHGTNAASAVLAGLQVIVVKTAEDGSIDSTHLDEVLDKHGDRIAAIMVTYPSRSEEHTSELQSRFELVC